MGFKGQRWWKSRDISNEEMITVVKAELVFWNPVQKVGNIGIKGREETYNLILKAKCALWINIHWFRS